MTASGTHRGLWLRFVLLVGMAAVLVFAVYFAYRPGRVVGKRAAGSCRGAHAECPDGRLLGLHRFHSGAHQLHPWRLRLQGRVLLGGRQGHSGCFTDRTDYSIRYVRENPRSGTDVPDDFERAALASFERGADEYFAMTDYEGSPAFRYVSVLAPSPAVCPATALRRGRRTSRGSSRRAWPPKMWPAR